MTTFTDDGFLGGALDIRQPATGFRAGVDSVLLAAAVNAPPGARVLELGVGAGVAALCLLKRAKDITVTGVEIDADMAKLAQENAARNAVAKRFRVRIGDAAHPQRLELKEGSFDHVMANPPWFDHSSAQPPADTGRAIAHMATADLLENWLKAAARMLRHGGGLTLVHRAEALPEALAALARRFGDVRVLPIQPKREQPAIRVIIGARKGKRAPLRLLPPFVLHEPDGRFTEAAEAILRHGACVDMHR